jgi:hypothetical protein
MRSVIFLPPPVGVCIQCANCSYFFSLLTIGSNRARILRRFLDEFVPEMQHSPIVLAILEPRRPLKQSVLPWVTTLHQR